MRRFQLFEFTDLGFWPDVFRTLLTDHLHTLLEMAQPFNFKAAAIAEAMRHANTRQIIDICSGGIGPWLHLKAEVEKELGEEISIVLTDKFPDLLTAARVEKMKGLEYCLESVDALAVPDKFDGVRTIVNGLHHFSPGLVRGILLDAVNKNQPIIVLEALRRTWRDVIFAAPIPLFVLFFAPFVKPRKLSRFFFTYLIPIAPIVISWDVIVSVLRCYTSKELLEFGKSTGGNYEWEAGEYHHKGMPVTWFVGRPKRDLAPA